LLGSAAVRAASSILAILFQFPLLGSGVEKWLFTSSTHLSFNSLCWVPFYWGFTPLGGEKLSIPFVGFGMHLQGMVCQHTLIVVLSIPFVGFRNSIGLACYSL